MRGLAAVKNTKVLKEQEGILEQGMYALVEATDVINKDRKLAAKGASDFAPDD